MKKRIAALFLAFSLCLGLTGQAFAAWEPEGEILTGSSSTIPFDRSETAPDYVSTRLGPADQGLYNLLKQKFTQVANGQLDSSQFTIDVRNVEIYHTGPSSISANVDAIIKAILVDCPYEQYWFDKTKSCQYSWSYDSKTYRLTTFSISMRTVYDYAQDVPGKNEYYHFRPDPNKTKAAAAAMNNARALVQQNSGKSDYEKLTAYKDYICNQVEYDHNVIKIDDYYGAPWQLINVFDNNPNTNVVCEGYSKAFKYLCDNSTFTNDISCYLVVGDTTGPHMWNTVRVNGQSYLADLTACDGSSGASNYWFLVGAPNCTTNGFTLHSPYTNSYTYWDETRQYYGKEILLLSPTNLNPASLNTPEPTPTPTPTPTLPELETDFENLSVHELAASGYSFDDEEYTLGDRPADLSVLVLGSHDCGITARTLKAVKDELAELGVSDARIYLVEIQDDGPAGQDSVRQWLKKNPTYVHVIASDKTTSPYNRVFWDITYACDGRNGQQSATMPAVVALDKTSWPFYYASHETFDRDKFREAVASYGESFSDVPAGAYYEKAVNWAVSGKITIGTGNNRFSPTQTCTHAHIITFLWRAMGEPKSSSFTPPSWVTLQSNHFAYDAVGWAGTKGMLSNLYGSPDVSCTRAQAMYYIWSAFGRPGGGTATFSDVDPNMYYAQAISWAADLGVANGTGGGKFSPDQVCDRGTIVTFLHRAFVEEVRV